MNRRFGVLIWGVLSTAAFARVAHAEPTATQKATAETLFQRGVELTDSGRIAEACTQFDASLQIDSALGTLFRLADCYDRTGRTASAWALFSEAQARAKAADQSERARIATERVTNLELRLSKLSLSVGDNEGLSGLELRMNDVIVPRASWGLELPVDPGLQRLRLSAHGHRDWVGTVMVEGGPSTRQLTLPPLVARPVVAKPVETPAPRKPAPEPVHDSGPYPAWLGYAIGGVGLASAGVAGFLGYRAYDLNQQSLDQCSRVDSNACTRRGDGLRDDARQAGTTATVFAVTGGALLAAGLTLTLVRPARAGRVGNLTLSTQLSAHGTVAGLTGAF